MNRLTGICPICGKNLKIARLVCVHCKTNFEGKFNFTNLGRLALADQEFIEIFLRSRGNIREVEKILAVSYPTVCKRLEEINKKIQETERIKTK